MKPLHLLGLFLLTLLATPVSAAVTPDDPGNFITTWNTENPGTSANNQITIPGTGGGYNYEIYWESTASSTQNGTTSIITSSSYTLTFPEPGIYEVQASGTIPRIRFAYGGDRQKILTVEQWGDNQWTSMNNAFAGAVNLRIPATDAPDLSLVTDISFMFNNASSFNDPINHWDVSNVTTLKEMFRRATNFNQPLNNWDVSNVEDFSFMFYTFNGSGFDGSAFNQPLDQWDVSSGDNFIFMFGGATSFNQPLNSWRFSTTTDVDLWGMFQYSAFNQPLDEWDLSSVTRIANLFQESPFNQDISMWDTSNVENMRNMFDNDDGLSTPVEFDQQFNYDISSWNTASVTNMSRMFRGNTSFNHSLAPWDVSNVTDMTDMFENAGLSQSNQDATLTAWSEQSLQDDVPFHLGLKTYTDTGAAAIETLEDTYNWTITEQYQATYNTEPDVSIAGDAIQAYLDSGDTTTPVTANPDDNCTFVAWSDGSTDNPRTDTLTDNLTVLADVDCQSSGTRVRTPRTTTPEPDTEVDTILADRFDVSETTAHHTVRQDLERTKAVLEDIAANTPTVEPGSRVHTLIQELETLLARLKTLISMVYDPEGVRVV